MNTGIALVKQMRQMEFPESHTREMRALFVAQAVAYRVPISAAEPAEEFIKAHEGTFLDILNKVNEVVAVDTKLCRAVFRKLITVRTELLQGVGDPVLLQHALLSTEQGRASGPDMAEVVKAFASHPEFVRHQHAVSDILAVERDAGGEDAS